ncbi:metallophosphoesterase family protein [Alteromonas flava]|uniref:metallophosphoesterase family protein n=1 Tax=Alteromonas flava TaxID=2048003 RepID=UPI0013DC3E75|nr:metallophosphoesterase [Alteromonas flava]
MSDTYRLIQISDCHLFADRDKVGYQGINPYRSLQQVLIKLRTLEPDCVLLSGDISGDESAASYQHFLTLWDQYCPAVKLLSLAGNHDATDRWQQAFAATHSLTEHALNPQGWRLHCLPARFVGTRGEIATADIEQLIARLQQHSAQHHIVALHHPIQNANVWMDKHALINPEVLTPLLQQPNLKLILHGHVHTARHIKVGQVDVLACPSTCWQWGNTAEFSVVEEPPGMRLIELDDEGQFSHSLHFVANSVV